VNPASQNTPFGHGTNIHVDGKIAAPIGGSARCSE
jgi:hypothetical protein